MITVTGLPYMYRWKCSQAHTTARPSRLVCGYHCSMLERAWLANVTTQPSSCMSECCVRIADSLTGLASTTVYVCLCGSKYPITGLTAKACFSLLNASSCSLVYFHLTGSPLSVLHVSRCRGAETNRAQ